MTNAGNPHRTFAVDTAVNLWAMANFKAIPDKDYPMGFLADVIAAMSNKLKNNSASSARGYQFFEQSQGCVYHEHAILHTRCYNTKRGFWTEEEYATLEY